MPSPNLALAYLAPQQAQKHVTVNEALRRLDALVQLSVLSASTTAQPGAPADGDRYILPASATGVAWATFAEGSVAAWQDDAWMEYPPPVGWLAFVADEGKLRVRTATGWEVASGGESADLFGVNTTADSINRLAVKSDAVLFSHDDVAPGSGDVRVKVNKAVTAGTAAHLFQTNYSGRAEFGLTGDDDFHLRVSPDGIAWKTAMVIDRSSANVRIGPTGNGKFTVVGDNVSDAQMGDFNVIKESWFSLNFFDVYSGIIPGHAANFLMRRARGSLASPAAVESGDTGGNFGWRYFADGVFQQRALIGSIVDGTVSGSTVPAALYFAAGNTSATERMRITSAGDVGIGTSAPTARLHVDGAVRVGNYTVAGLPSASFSGAGAVVHVSNESGGATLAFSDGTNWRRVTDRAVVS